MELRDALKWLADNLDKRADPLIGPAIEALLALNARLSELEQEKATGPN